MPNDPLAFFITFSTYGSWLHGKDNGSVDREHNEYDTLLLPPDPDTEAEKRTGMSQQPYELDAPRRRVVLDAIQGVCRHRGWYLAACHVRTTHVHVVVAANAPPEKVMNALKAYASRRLTEAGFDAREHKRWTRHGSTKYVWNEDSLINVVNYVFNEQGDPMERFVDPEFTPEATSSVTNQSRDR